jgi:hypothetical protein
MVFNPPYELKIANDSTVLLETPGILGETLVDIDAASATGPPIGADAVLKSQANSAANHGTVHRKAERSFGEEKLRL